MTLNKDLVVVGCVKWFDSKKGFGFVIPSDGSHDILLHANVLRSFGQSSVVGGAEVEILVEHTPRGRQATEIINIITVETDDVMPLSEVAGYTTDQIAALPIKPARVKWYDQTKGYGFANAFGSDVDVFIHDEVLHRSGQSDLQSGEAIGLRIVYGTRGPTAADVVVWEDAMSLMVAE